MAPHYRKNMPKSYWFFFFLAMQCVGSWFLTRDQAHAPYFGNSECFFIFLNLFLIALGLVAAHRLSLVVESGGYSVAAVHGLIVVASLEKDGL